MPMRQLAALAGQQILQHFQMRVNYLDMLMSLNTTAEEWFRIELLGVLRSLPGITVAGTNHQIEDGADRPDFTLQLGDDRLLVELKVLPKDRNYGYGWQRFQAGANNKKDFNNVADGARSGVIYIYWPERDDWQGCRANIERSFAVECVREDVVACTAGTAILSYWASAEARE